MSTTPLPFPVDPRMAELDQMLANDKPEPRRYRRIRHPHLIERDWTKRRKAYLIRAGRLDDYEAEFGVPAPKGPGRAGDVSDE